VGIRGRREFRREGWILTTWWSLARETENAISASIATFTKDLWKEDSLTIETVKVTVEGRGLKD
jgi:hypothetical protein